MKSLDLFSGYGGITLALQDYVKPIAYVEIEEYAQKIIAYRMADGSLPRAAILGDVKNVRGSVGVCDIITGGFPCQDLSVAGHGKGLAGERSGLFGEVVRLTTEIEPRFVFLENVPAIRTRGLREVAESFASIGYDCRWLVLSARSVGAPHIRKRWFCLAKKRTDRPERESNLAYSGGIRHEAGEDRNDFSESGKEKASRENTKRNEDETKRILCREWWGNEPDVGRVVDGASFRLDRIKALGNGVVPLQAKIAFEILMGITK